jgi:hypothetical protein
MDVTPNMTIEEIIRHHPETEEILLDFFEGGDYSPNLYATSLEEMADLAGLDLDDILDELAQLIAEEGEE